MVRWAGLLGLLGGLVAPAAAQMQELDNRFYSTSPARVWGGQAGHVEVAQKAVVTLATCGTGAITAGSTDVAGGFQVVGATSCIVTFAGTWTNTPFCVATNVTTAAKPPRISAISATTFTVDTLTDGDTVMYLCLGRFVQ
jgi:hypothetical protein